ncbi:hypothetical protein A2V54_01345 [candidate division WWE3 bacterium RBG_19FT_COMBO_53_11]|uniref:Adenylate kinase n=1 Tax=candidate division WWE3 bacterium RBG_19FT_COMBO_53_11 TaxID=1802613 RepID=A0A1F4UJ81_UNCKA|nr:MAG: hypothetical protein A2V54_01345 [candidate division WWE3 bacterium RBG_19FT_COMBO_53_11]
MKPGVILLMGLPGAGKGTQAFRLAERFPNFVHFDTGGEIFRRVTDPAFADDPIIQRENKRYFNKVLNTPSWVTEIVSERIRYYSGQGKGLVFSGSPRTPPEAQAVLPLLEDCYGRDRLLVLEVVVSPETATERSRTRLTCNNKLCRYGATLEQRGKPCPECGNPLPQEQQDEEKWKYEGMADGTRIREFEQLTQPAMELLKKRLTHARIDGEKSEDEVFGQILTAVEKNLS